MLEHPWYRVVAELTDAVTSLTSDFWRRRRVRNLHLPLTTGAVSSPMGLGSDSSPVAVTVGGVRTYLADSMQFLLEYGCRIFPAGCYYLMPSFRGEDADATHLPQFFHSEAELPGGLDDVVSAVEDYVAFLAQELLTDLGAQIAQIAGTLDHLDRLAEGGPLDRLTLDEAERVLDGDPVFVRRDPVGFRALTRAGERKLIERAAGGFVWVTEMDHLGVPFYQAFADDDRRLARNADLLFGVGETVGAGERHVDAASLDEALALHGVDAEHYSWYRTMKELHPLRTAGFGMGVERFLLWVLRHDDIRDIPLVLRFNRQSIEP
ncbi:MAG: asparaginase [Actinomycetota bacterium]|nr:asparaginase [Actinomycetota bacterium]